MDMDAALKDGYSLAEVNAEAARRTGFKYDAALSDGYSDADINIELRKRLAKTSMPTKAQETSQAGESIKKFLLGDNTPDESQRNSSLVNQIPGIGPEAPLPPKSTGLLQKFIGAGDMALSQGANLLGSIPASVALAGAAITHPLHGVSPPEVFEKVMQSAYQPKTEEGKKQNEWVNENISRHLLAAFPAFHEAQARSAAKKVTTEAESVVRRANKDAELARDMARLQQERAAKQDAQTMGPPREQAGPPEPAYTGPEVPEMVGPTREMPADGFPSLDRQLSEAGLIPDLAKETPEQPLPFVPELYKEEAPRVSGVRDTFEQTMTEVERTNAERAAALKDPLQFERTPIEPSIPDYVPQESGMPFSVEGKLSTPVEVNRASRNVQQGIRDIEGTAAEIRAAREEAAGKTAVGPEQDMAIQGMEHDLANAQGRTAAASEAATQMGRDLGQLKIDDGSGPRVPRQVGTNRGKLGQTSAGKGQRGSIGFFGGKTKGDFAEYAKNLRDIMPDVTPEEIKSAWEKRTGQITLAETERKNTAIYGNPLREKPGVRVEFTKYDPEKLLEDLKNAPDSLLDENWFEKTIMSSGYMRAIVQDNPAVSQAIRYLKSVKDINANRAEKALFGLGRESEGKPSGLIHAMTTKEKLGNVKEMADLVKQWFAAKDNPDYKFNLSPTQEKINQQKIALFNKMKDEVNRYLPEKRQLKELPNYIPSVHTGKFYMEIAATKADGSKTKPILWGVDNSRSAEGIRNYLVDRGYTVSKIKTRGRVENNFGDAAQNRAANYQYMLDILTDSDPDVVKLGKEVSNEQQRRATTTSGEHQRFKDYHGFKGEMGNNPLKSDKQNYYDAKKMLIDVVESHYEWLAAQKGAEFGKKITESGNKIGENNRAIVNRYIDDSVIGKRFSNGFENVGHSIIEGITGASEHQQKQVANTIGNTLTAFMTSMGSPIHALQNVVQPLTVVIPKMLEMGLHPVDMTTILAKGAAEYLMIFGGKQVHEVAKLFGNERVDFRGMKEKQNFAERAGIISPTIVDTKPLFNNKYANRAHQFGTQGLISKPSEQAARFTVFSAMADFYQKRGMSKQEAFNAAREVTENYMVDYSPDAKANLWKDAGFVGNLAGRLQQFATNNLSQTYAYGKAAKNGGANAKMAFAGYLGVLATLGGVAGLPFYDAFEEIINSLKSRDGKQFSLRNEIRSSVGDMAIGGAWEAFGLGAAPSFATRSINADGSVPLPSMLGFPTFSKVPEIARTIGRRVGGKTALNEETEAEKGRELLSVLPVSARGVIERKYLTENVGGREHNISPMSGKVLHTKQGPENSFGNIRSAERAKSADLSNQSYESEKRFIEQRKSLESDLDGQIRDIYQYGNGNAQKQLKFLKNYNKFVVQYAGNPEEINQVLNKIRPYVTDEYLEKITQIGQKPNPTLEDVRQLRKALEYQKLKTGTK